MSIPSDAQIRERMEEMMKVVDLETMSTKQFIAALSSKLGGSEPVDLSAKKKFIKATITEIIDAMENDDDDNDDDSVDESSEDEVVVPKKRAAGGLSAVKEISDELAAFLGERRVARTTIVKSLWAYVRENNLQNPNDKREILLDDKMKSVFGVDSFTMFTMNKYIGAHVEPYKPVDLTTSSTPKKRKAGCKDASATKKGRAGTQAPYRLSEALAAVVGKEVLPRPQVTQGLWAYIREHDLQNPKDKREIICDDALRSVMGGKKKVTMFTMNKHITPHLLERVGKSEYHHEEAVSEAGSGTEGSDSDGNVPH